MNKTNWQHTLLSTKVISVQSSCGERDSNGSKNKKERPSFAVFCDNYEHDEQCDGLHSAISPTIMTRPAS